MRNTKGIILNGEWLGNNVIVNEMFNVIFAISPIVMQEFLRVVNGIEQLEDAVHINNFNYNNKNVIDIEFSNSELSGMASLLFKTRNGEHELVDCFLKVDRECDKKVEEQPVIDVKEEKKSKKAKKVKKEKVEEPKPVVEETTEEELKEEKVEEIEKIKEEPKAEEPKQIEEQEEEEPETVVQKEIVEKTVEVIKESTLDEKEIKKQLKNELKDELKSEIKDELQDEIDAVKADKKSYVPERPERPERQERNARKKEDGSCPFANIASCFNNICETTHLLANKIRQSARTPEPAPVAPQRQIVQQVQAPAPAPAPAPRVERAPRQEYQEPRPMRRPQPQPAPQPAPQPQAAAPQPAPQPQPQPVEQPKQEVKTAEEVKETIAQNSSLLSEDEQRAMIEEVKKLKEQLDLMRKTMDEKEVAKLEAEQAKSMLDRFIESQKKKAESKADTYGFNFRIVGSDKSMNADVVDESVFIAGDKIYKWGEKLYLEN